MKQLKDIFFRYGPHILVWMAVLFLPSILSFRKAVQFDQLLQSPNDIKNLLSWGIFIGFAYVNHLWLVPTIYLKGERFLYFLAVALGLLLILFVPEGLGQLWDMRVGGMPPEILLPTDSFRPPKPSMVSEVSHLILLFIVSVLVSVAYHTQMRLKNIEQQKLETELNHLKAQIHPHFLFNTLNSIYALAIRKDDKTADAVVRLATFLRYIIRDARDHEVPLEKELEYIRNYLDLQRSRLRDSVEINVSMTGNTKEHKIVPLILFGFIENAFKHGVNPEEDSQIDIEIKVEATQIHLMVHNKKVQIIDTDDEVGVGIENARKRLVLLYPDRHRLAINDQPTDYTIDLSILI